MASRKKMLAVQKACQAAGVDVPLAVAEYFKKKPLQCQVPPQELIDAFHKIINELKKFTTLTVVVPKLGLKLECEVSYISVEDDDPRAEIDIYGLHLCRSPKDPLTKFLWENISGRWEDGNIDDGWLDQLHDMVSHSAEYKALMKEVLFYKGRLEQIANQCPDYDWDFTI